MVRVLVATCFALLIPVTVSSETIINKSDADHIFSLSRTAWDAYAERMIHPNGWKVQLSRIDTGTVVMAFDSITGMGMSIQPLYHDDGKAPRMLIVGSFYPKGSLPPSTSESRAKIESEAQKDLGRNYSIRARRADVSAWDGIELIINRK